MNLLQPAFALSASAEQIIDFDVSSVGKLATVFFEVTYATTPVGTAGLTIEIFSAYSANTLVGDADGPSLPKVFGGAVGLTASSEGETYTLNTTVSGTTIKDITIDKSAFANQKIRTVITNRNGAQAGTVVIRGNVL